VVIASLLVSLAGVLAAGVGTFLAFRGNPRDYITLKRLRGGRVEPPAEEEVGLRDLILDQRAAAAWVLAGTALQVVSVLLALMGLR
jgi:hypothetical protein